jgi:hypothetical protein
MKRLLSATLLIVSIIPAFAQDLNPPKQITDLKWMVGSWSGTGQISFGGHSTPITSTYTGSFDGQFLKLTSIDTSSGSHLTKTTMMGWDANKHEYVSYTFTNMAPTARIARGTMHGSKLIMISQPWHAEGFTTVSRETMSKLSDTTFGMKLDLQTGNKWQTGMDFVLTKNG